MNAITYLSPGIPRAFYELLVGRIAREIGVPIALACDARSSGPLPGAPNPLTRGDAVLAFMCAPSYVAMAAEVTLLGLAPVFADPRANGRPVYFAEVVARADLPGGSLIELADLRFAFNDAASLSGRIAVMAHIRAAGAPPPVAIASGSHEASLAMVRAGDADFCSVDSVVWRRLAGEDAVSVHGLRLVESLGPYPIQPIVASKRLDSSALAAAERALSSLGSVELAPFGATAMAPVTPAEYLSLLPLLPGSRPGGADSAL